MNCSGWEVRAPVDVTTASWERSRWTVAQVLKNRLQAGCKY
ncbi:unnamed protein product [Gongylonema pulchrum]|uniref:RVT_N domain-containing protein n=1 Tax=Gongylonema pulchrum TaxID=637853 RepID=A0A183DAW6_9BILA|nr:unnamed protein product [Gongylonema pulchrum]